MSKFYNLFLIISALSIFINTCDLKAKDKPLVIASTTDIASITKFLTGEDAGDVECAMPSSSDPNFVTPRQPAIYKAKDADFFIKVGIGLEDKWEGAFHMQANSPEIAIGSIGNVDVCSGISLLPTNSDDVKTLPIIHKKGNPYVWLNPENGKTIASNICELLSSTYPKYGKTYRKNLDDFNKMIDDSMPKWEKNMASFKDKKVVAYQHSFDYLAKRFGFDIINYIEPAAGIPATASRVEEVIKFIKDNNVKYLLITDYNGKRFPNVIVKETGINLMVLPVCTGNDYNDYIKLFDHITKMFATETLKQKVESKDNKTENNPKPVDKNQ